MNKLKIAFLIVSHVAVVSPARAHSQVIAPATGDCLEVAQVGRFQHDFEHMSKRSSKHKE
jgi:hypothetical protein